MSLLIVSVGLAALSPVLATVAYRRALAQRIETAQQLARSELDRIRTLIDLELFDKDRLRSLTIDSPGFTAAQKQAAFLAQLPNVTPDFGSPENIPTPTEVPDPPNQQVNNQDPEYSVRQAVVGSTSGRPDYYVIQTYRDAGSDCINPRTLVPIVGIPCSFQVGVRVYHRLSFDQSTGDALDNPPLETEVVSSLRDLQAASTWRFPFASASVRIDAASDLGGICRNLAVDVTDCDGI
ncbi:MAG: prepilin-type cleavage/methylation domain-containing protein [Synechococcaceae cyanobacterium SM2_3_2]|nr:prepilin-type cleavage/methylation domain-containing protein [Synechococcaceae cyanobacterium SM2_3_2]